MKKIYLILAIIVITVFVSNFQYAKKETINAKLYYVDHSVLRLIPVNYNIYSEKKENACKEILKKLVNGEDNNHKILRVIPNIKNSADVKVKKNTAVVNLKEEFLNNFTDNKNHQLLAIYSIVNSLTSVDGIDTVQFLIDGEVKKIFFAGIDMRETFIPDYYI